MRLLPCDLLPVVNQQISRFLGFGRLVSLVNLFTGAVEQVGLLGHDSFQFFLAYAELHQSFSLKDI